MTALRYCDDFDAVRDRLTAWWRGESLGRPAVQISTPGGPRYETDELPPAPGPASYTTRSFDYRVACSRHVCDGRLFLGEAVPAVTPDLAPNCLALYLGCHGVEGPDTVWCEPCIAAPESATFEHASDNFYWDFTLRLAREQARLGEGKFRLEFPDLIEGLDTLAAMRGTEDLLFDLVERPEWVQDSLARITDCYFTYYDALYDLMRDERGGSIFWAWAPGRMAKLQCDFSAMISPDMFGEFMVPVLETMAARLDYVLYHWDGPAALPHHDHLLSVAGLDAIQWVPGAGVPDVLDPQWWPLYHKTLDAGKAVVIDIFNGETADFGPIKREFGPRFVRFMLRIYGVKSATRGEELLRAVEL